MDVLEITIRKSWKRAPWVAILLIFLHWLTDAIADQWMAWLIWAVLDAIGYFAIGAWIASALRPESPTRDEVRGAGAIAGSMSAALVFLGALLLSILGIWDYPVLIFALPDIFISIFAGLLGSHLVDKTMGPVDW
ncbi:MAG: hypothetical protein D6694_14040 [Gammaproteobacteria bacterium]|nr:MAG: hypothetical protein D6694_14040 [Gammaproteobacteria bacterium]